jgi:hypothetical protein
MEFIWNDGGRAASGFVGLTGDCVTRAIAIATGVSYRDVYEQLGKRCQKSPRKGIETIYAADYLNERGWQRHDGGELPFTAQNLPKGVVIAHVCDSHGRSNHFCTVIDHVVYDTWNPADDSDYIVNGFWTHAERLSEGTLPSFGPKRTISKEQELTQQEFDKILRRLKALDNTANNDASTEGEKRNALRMMQTLMLRHNLTRDDIVADDQVDSMQFTRMTCPVNGRRACNWEKSLAGYVCREIFPMVQWYLGTKGHRTIFTFYGPLADVRNSIALFRELLLTIASAAHLQYGSYARGSGASYAEGYVAGLPRTKLATGERSQVVSEQALIHTRTLTIHNAARSWLRTECNISLTTSRGRGRYLHDPQAESRGKEHGAQHNVTAPGAPKRITSQ